MIITTSARTGLKLTKKLARNLAAQALMKNKRATEVSVRGYDRTVVYTYKGQRQDVQGIVDNLVMNRTFETEECDYADQ